MALTDSGPARLSPLAALVARVKTLLADQTHSMLAKRVAGTAFIIRIASAALIYVSQILFARWMGAFEFGVYVYVWTWLLLLGALAPLGLSYLAQRFIPEYRAKGQLDHLRGFLFASRWVCFGLGTAVGIAGIVAVTTFADHVTPVYVLPFVLAFSCLPIFAVSSTQDSIATSYNWPDLALLPGYIARPLLILTLLAVFHLAGDQIDAASVLMAFLIALWVTTLGQMALLRLRLPKHVPHGPRQTEIPRWLRTAMPVLMADGFVFLLTYIDVLLLKLFVGAEDIALYYAATKTLALVAIVYFAVASACAHRFSEYFASGDKDRLSQFAHEATRMMFWPSLALTALLIVFGKWVLLLFGPGFAAAYPLICVLSIGLLARASVGPSERLLNMVGRQKACAAVYAAAVTTNIALCFLLVPRLGLMGAAVATASALTVESTLLFLVARMKLGIHVFIWRPKTA